MNRRSLWSTKEAASYLGVSPSTMRTWRKRGKGPAFKKPSSGGYSQAFYEPEVVELFKLRRDQHAIVSD